MSDLLKAASENDTLRRCMENLLTITTLPETWTGESAADIGNSLLNALAEILDVDFLFLRITPGNGQPTVEIARIPAGEGFSHAAELGAFLSQGLGDVGSEWPQFANLRSDNAEYVTVQQYLGIHRSIGVLVAGSRQTSFPSEQDRLVLHVAANQVAGVLSEVLRLGLDASGAAVKAHNRIVDAIPVMAWSTLPDGTADFFNGHFLSYLGVTTEQASGWGWAAALHPDDAESLKAVWIEMLASGRAGEAEARLRRWDGEYRWFLFRANPLFADDASIARWYGTNTDIDDRKRAEEGLRRSAAFLAQGQRLTETGSVWWRPATEEIVWSDEAYRVAGYPTTQIPTVDLMLGRCDPEDLPQVSSLVMRAMQDGEDMELEHRLLMPDGKVKYVYVVLQNIGSDPSDPEFIGAVSDITDRKIAEERLRRSEVLLAEGQRISRTGTFSWKVDTDEITFSKELNRIFGFEPETVVDFNKITERVFEEDLPLLAKKMADVRQGGDNPDYEIRLFVGGQVKHVRVVGRIVRLFDDTTECVGAIQDVSAQRVAELARDKLRTELAQVARVMSLGRMAASIAHEVNQPLSGIITNANTSLRMLSATPPNIQGAIETARRTIRDANRAAEVIARLRRLFKRGVTVVEPVDLNEAAREVISLLSNDMQRGRISVDVELSAALPLVAGDRVQLQQVIMNFLRNSIDAMAGVSPGSRNIAVRTAPVGTKEVHLTVEDTGAGLGTTDIARLFDEFHTTKLDGTGIGLSVSRSIIEGHGGAIWAERNPAGGAIFGFSLPIQASSDDPAAGAEADHP
jgi:PAS domain S-box-containing protein